MFLGREANLAQLRSILDKVLRGQSDTVFVTGETGIERPP
jgi:predicted ATPase